MDDLPHPIVELYLPSAFALFVLVVLWRRWPVGWAPRLWSQHAWWVFALTRIALPVWLYVVLEMTSGQWGSDAWYWQKSTDALFRDGAASDAFENLYGPLLPCLQAGARSLLPGRHWVAALLPFVVGDALALYFAGRLARTLGGRHAAAWVGAWLLLTPLTWHLLSVRGQDEPLIAGTLLAGVWLLHLKRTGWAGIVFAIGLVATKPTYVILAGAALLTVSRKDHQALRGWAGFIGTTLAVYALYVIAGARLASDGTVRFLSTNYGVGVSGVDVLQRIGVPLPLEAAIVLFVAAVSLVVAAIVRRVRGRPAAERAVLATAAAHAVTMLFAPMCVTTYVTQGLALALLVLVVAPGRPRLRNVTAALLALLGLLVPLLWVFPSVVIAPLAATSIVAHAALLALVWHASSAAP